MPAFLDSVVNVESVSLLMTAGLVVLGCVVGAMTGLFGVGGAFLVTPILIILGVNETEAVGSSLCFVIGTSAAGARRHWRRGNVELRSLLVIGAASAVGAVLGSMLHAGLEQALGKGEGFNFAVLMRVCYLVLLPVTAYLAYRGPKEHHSGKTPLERMPLGPRMSLPSVGHEHVSLPGLCLVGLGVGALTGLLGVGGGVLYMPLLLLLVGLPAHKAVGTSLGIVLFSAITGTATHAVTGKVNLLIAMALLVGSTLGVQVGAALTGRLHGTHLRKYFAMVVLLATLVVALQLANMVFGES